MEFLLIAIGGLFAEGGSRPIRRLWSDEYRPLPRKRRPSDPLPVSEFDSVWHWVGYFAVIGLVVLVVVGLLTFITLV